MFSVGIITFHKSVNYGAILQTYALQTALDSLGYSAEVIDYSCPKRGIANLSLWRRFLHTLWHKAFVKILVGNSRKTKTDAFRRENLRLSLREYSDAETLHSDPPGYDFYITGSDQVWNPRNTNNDSSYFLSFVPRGKKRISYAASFGVSKIPREFEQEYVGRLNEIHHLSVRELEGAKIVKSLTGREVDVVLDPTLLLSMDRWSEIAVPFGKSEPYILCYFMPGDKKVNKCITDFAKKISKKTGWKIISIGQKEYMRLNLFASSVFSAGPEEFLGLFQNASFVLTNSFHGTCFSLIFKKPFFVPINSDLPPEKVLNSRITTLLKTLDLERRLIHSGQSLPNDLFIDLNYQSITAKLKDERRRSLNFLGNALGGG